MSGTARLATPNPTADDAGREAKPRRRRQATLVTQDDALWPLVGAAIPSDVVLSQADTVAQLVGASDAGVAGVVIWDTRAESNPADSLAALQQHSARLAVMVLDEPARAAHWQRLIKKGQLVACAPLPFDAAAFRSALESTLEEAQVRVALLGQSESRPAATPADVEASASTDGAARSRNDVVDRPPPRRPLALPALGALALVAVASGLWWWTSRPVAHAPPAAAASGAPASPAASLPASGTQPAADSGPALELSLSKARRAMAERRYIEPANDSALAYYREALVRDPANAEAKQGLVRLEQVLLAHAETALDQRQFDVALQSLEVARSIDKDDKRIPALDARVLQLKAELGAASIQAAINAGNYDRAGAQINEAARAKSLPAEQLASLRDSLRAHQAADADRAAKAQAKAQAERAAQEAKQQAAREQEMAERQRLANLFQERLAQGKLTEPARDSAAYYLDALKSADPQNTQLAAWQTELKQKLDAQHAAGAATATTTTARAAETPLVLVKPIRPSYPTEALRDGTEGWVDLAFQVGPDGRPGSIEVVDAQPRGVFDRAAVSAIQAARYQALPRNVPQVARSAKQRVTFKLAH